MLKKIRKATAIFLAFMMIFASTVGMTFGTVESADKQALKESRETAVLQNIVDSWERQSVIKNIKEVSDFAGNSYLVAECEPIGYIIYNRASGIVMEEGEYSISPYLNIEDGVYSGLGQYFQFLEGKNVWAHTITGNILEKEQIADYAEICKEAQLSLNANADEKVLDYVKKVKGKSNIEPYAVTNTYIGGHKSFFTNLSTKTKMGYWSIGNGACGYVAAGIVLLYYDKYLNSSFIVNSKYLNSSGDAFTGDAFTKHLYYDIGVAKLGYSNTTDGKQVANIMKRYLKDERSITATCWTATGTVIDGILTQLKIRNIPVVYVDRFNNPSGSGTVDHDIVVYGYDSNNNLITHFGWENKTHIKCSSPAAAAFIASACAITYY